MNGQYMSLWDAFLLFGFFYGIWSIIFALLQAVIFIFIRGLTK